jgi:hypothetical protein
VITSDPLRKNKVAFNLIYDLNPTKDPSCPEIWILDTALKPTEAMKDISCRSEAVPTTLWFQGQEENLKRLVVCGQCTTVYSLLRYLWQQWFIESDHGEKNIPKPNDPNSPWYEKYQAWSKVWDELKTDPHKYLDRKRG